MLFSLLVFIHHLFSMLFHHYFDGGMLGVCVYVFMCVKCQTQTMNETRFVSCQILQAPQNAEHLNISHGTQDDVQVM